MPQTKREIQKHLDSAGIKPLRRFGQHFLIDGNLMQKLVDAAELQPTDTVLEVGPGTGSLTQLLLGGAGHVVAVEVDHGLMGLLEDVFAGETHLTLIRADVLSRKSAIAPIVLTTLAAQQQQLGGRLLMVANLPYQVATPLLIDMLVCELEVTPMCFTVQAETADRIAAKPGSKDYGPLSVILQALTRIHRIARVPPGAFWPAPKVDSAMLHLDKLDTLRVRPTRDRLIRLVRGCFLHRRKTLRWSLDRLLEPPLLDSLKQNSAWNLEDRPERISVERWIELASM